MSDKFEVFEVFTEKWNKEALSFRWIERSTGLDVTGDYTETERIGLYSCYLADCPDVAHLEMTK